MLNPRSGFFDFADCSILPLRSAVCNGCLSLGKIFRIRRVPFESPAFAPYSRVTPHPRFIAMSKVAQHLRIMHVGGVSPPREMNQPGFVIHADVPSSRNTTGCLCASVSSIGITGFVFVLVELGVRWCWHPRSCLVIFSTHFLRDTH